MAIAANGVSQSQWIRSFWIFCILSALTMLAHAQVTPQMQTGLNWLRMQVKADGSFAGDSASLGLSFQIQSEAALALRLQGGTLPDGLRTILQPLSADPLEPLARKAIVQNDLSIDVSSAQQRIASKQNPDGGWGEDSGYSSNPLDTALALQALSSSGTTYSSVASAGLNYLTKVSNGSGRYGVNGQDTIYITAQVGLAVSSWSDRFVTTPLIQPIETWLLGQRSSTTSAYASTFENAHVLMILLKLSADTCTRQKMAMI